MCLLVPLLPAGQAGAAASAHTTLMSVSVAGKTGNRQSFDPDISADGRWVAFASDASDLVPNDTNGSSDIFMRDRATGTTRRVSVSSTGDQLSQGSSEPSISFDGRVVAFRHGGGFGTDIYVHDRDADGDRLFDETGAVTTTAITGKSSLTTNPAVSGDGRYVAFDTYLALVPEDANLTSDVYVYEPATRTLRLVSAASSGLAANHASSFPSISGNGRYVTFASSASDVVLTDSNGETDVFLRDRDTDGNRVFDEVGKAVTTLVSVSVEGGSANGGSGHNSVSGDGRRVAFYSEASDLLADGADKNGYGDVFVRDVSTGTVLASVSSAGVQANSGGHWPLELSPDGAYVAFQSDASNLVPEDLDGGFGGFHYTDIFVHHLDTRTTTRASVSSSGEEANGHSDSPAISADGREVAFTSHATNLTAEKDENTNDGLPGGSPAADVFVHAAPRAPAVRFTARSATTGQYSKTVVVEADLTELTKGACPLSGERCPLAGVELSFALSGPAGSPRATAVTNAQGVATATLTVAEPAGTYPLLASYAGQPGAYQPASAAVDFTVTPKDSAMTLTVASGNKRVLTARLYDADTPATGLAGRVVSFSADGVALGTVVTDSDGIARLSPPRKYRRGSYTFRADFAGDGYYGASSASART